MITWADIDISDVMDPEVISYDDPFVYLCVLKLIV